MGTRVRFLLVLLVAVVAVAAAFALLHGPWRGAPAAAPPTIAARRGPDKLRIVSLAPNVTEILFALGLGQNIVGTTDSCDYPPEARSIPHVGGFGTPNVETLLAVAPDLVIASGLEKPEVLTVFQQSGIRVLNVQPKGFIAGFAELCDAIRAIGEATGRAAEAQALVSRMEAQLQAVAARVATIAEDRRPRVFVEIDKAPLMTAGGGSFLDDMIARAGGRNVAHGIPSAYPRIDPEQVIAWNPEVILVGHSEAPGEAAKRLARQIGWSEIAAVRQRRIIDDIDPDLLFRPGPRLVEGVEQLARRLHAK
jgi:iron complex transport system substrate-binding protein